MWLVHDTEYDLGLVTVHCRNLGPEVRELLVRRTALSEQSRQYAPVPFCVARAENYVPNNLTLKSSIVVDINNTE